MSEEIAILSDTHANLEALSTVLKDIHNRKIKKIWHLGDIVGYGPNPIECLHIAQKDFEISLAGNHEIAIRVKIDSPESAQIGFSGTGAQEGVHWCIRQLYCDSTPVQNDYEAREQYTRELLKTAANPEYRALLAKALVGKLDLDEDVSLSLKQRISGSAKIKAQILEELFKNPDSDEKVRAFYKQIEWLANGKDKGLIEYLKKLPVKAEPMPGVLLVHDNEQNPGDMFYMLPSENAEKTGMIAYSINENIFEHLKQKGITRCFFGHSHIPGEYQNEQYPEIKLINVGTVGLPRFKEFKTSYVIWRPGAQNEFERVELPLDWEITNKKMIEAGLPEKMRRSYENLTTQVNGELD